MRAVLLATVSFQILLSLNQRVWAGPVVIWNFAGDRASGGTTIHLAFRREGTIYRAN
jgi:hypothetical protein